MEIGYSYVESCSSTKYEYIVEYKDKNDRNANWERCIQHHKTLDDCMKEYYNMERTGLWTLRVVKLAITETLLYMD